MEHERAEKKIFLGCLPASSDQKELAAYFQQFCLTILKIKIKYRSNNVCAGYGYFKACINEEQLKKMTEMNHYYKERSIECRVYLTGKALSEYQTAFNKRRVYIGGIPGNLTDRELFNCFSKFGKLQRAYIANCPDKDGNIFGFAVYFDEDSAEELIKLEKIELANGHELELKAVSTQKEKRSDKKEVVQKQATRIKKHTETLKKEESFSPVTQTSPTFPKNFRKFILPGFQLFPQKDNLVEDSQKRMGKKIPNIPSRMFQSKIMERKIKVNGKIKLINKKINLIEQNSSNLRINSFARNELRF